VGDIVTIVTASGKSWDARIVKVVWSDGKVAICATESCDRTSSRPVGRPRRGHGGECVCGWGDDLLSWGGYIGGRRYKCPHCGGWAEAC